MTQARKSNINAMLLALHAAGGPCTSGELLLARECAGMTAAQVAKTLDNMRLQRMASSDGGGGPKRPALWTLTDLGREKIAQRGLVATPAAASDGQTMLSPNEARPWAFAATGNAQLPDPRRALPSIAADKVAGMPVVEVDIDRAHFNPRLKGMAEAAFDPNTGRTTPDGDPNHTSVPEDPEFLCALFSDGVLSIDSNGQHVDLPLEHTRKLLRYLKGLAADAVVGDAA